MKRSMPGGVSASAAVGTRKQRTRAAASNATMAVRRRPATSRNEAPSWLGTVVFDRTLADVVAGRSNTGSRVSARSADPGDGASSIAARPRAAPGVGQEYERGRAATRGRRSGPALKWSRFASGDIADEGRGPVEHVVDDRPQGVPKARIRDELGVDQATNGLAQQADPGERIRFAGKQEHRASNRGPVRRACVERGRAG